MLLLLPCVTRKRVRKDVRVNCENHRRDFSESCEVLRSTFWRAKAIWSRWDVWVWRWFGVFLGIAWRYEWTWLEPLELTHLQVGVSLFSSWLKQWIWGTYTFILKSRRCVHQKTWKTSHLKDFQDSRLWATVGAAFREVNLAISKLLKSSAFERQVSVRILSRTPQNPHPTDSHLIIRLEVDNLERFQLDNCLKQKFRLLTEKLQSENLVELSKILAHLATIL